MSVVTAPEEVVGRLAPPRRKAPKRRWTPVVLRGYTILVIVYLILPIALMIMYSFNRTAAERVVLKWQGFTTEWYHPGALFAIGDLTAALKLSIEIAVFSTIVATILGTAIALALVRYRFRGRGIAEVVMFLNIAAPEIVVGAALLSFFVTLNVPRGFWTIFISHVMFNIAFVVVTVRARLAGYDTLVEDAAQDLYAGPWTTFRKVTLPLIYPGILAGALLAFALSIDDFVITNFVAGTDTTFPLWVYGSAKVGTPPQVFVMGTLIFVGGVILALISFTLQTKKGRAEEADRRASSAAVRRAGR
ncbi:MAG TPA: ABC transporter permease [Actinomycetota bacterium]|nr:ABC transporter permease [Actinomycetota bacterium]